MTTLAEAAERYAARGWHVFPLPPRAKKPLHRNAGGFREATDDDARVTAWWRARPDANIGLWPGPSGFVVIDVDGPPGETAARELGLLSEPTLECVTGRAEGGRHLYFRHPGFHVGNLYPAPHLEVKADAGYVVLPPSIHPTGARYRWLGKMDEIHALPPRAIDALHRTGGSSGDQGSARKIAFRDTIGEGERHNALTRYAGRLTLKSLKPDEVLQLLLALNAAHCRPPLPAAEVEAIVTGITTLHTARHQPHTSQGDDQRRRYGGAGYGRRR